MKEFFKAFVGETSEAMRLACIARGRRDSQVSEDAPEPEPADDRSLNLRANLRWRRMST
jgi:hypothetical protein